MLYVIRLAVAANQLPATILFDETPSCLIYPDASYWSVQSSSGSNWTYDVNTEMASTTLTSFTNDVSDRIRRNYVLSKGTRYYAQVRFSVSGDDNATLDDIKVKVVGYKDATYTNTDLLATLDNTSDLSQLIDIQPSSNYYGIGFYVDTTTGYLGTTVTVTYQGASLFQVLPYTTDLSNDKYKHTPAEITDILAKAKCRYADLAYSQIVRLRKGKKFCTAIENESIQLEQSIFALQRYGPYSTGNCQTNKQIEENIETILTFLTGNEKPIDINQGENGYLIDPQGNYVIDENNGRIISLT